MSAPRTSSCAPWITAAEVAAVPQVKAAVNAGLARASDPRNPLPLTTEAVDGYCAQAATMATEVLYAMSGRRFAGECGPVTIRPAARPLNADSRGWLNRNWAFSGYGSASLMTLAMPPIVSQWGENVAPEIILYDFPVRTVTLVKIDGEVIPPDEYELREFQRLIRLRTSASATPTDRWGWPTNQIADLPDTEIGTFSVTYTWGADPGEGGRVAAALLAAALALPQIDPTASYPTRLTQLTRQGVTTQVESVIDVVKNGGTGIYEVDLWLLAVNPNKGRRQAVIYSPNRAQNRRTARPTNS